MQEEARPSAVESVSTFEPVVGEATQGLGEFLVRERKLPDEDAFLRVRRESIDIVRRCKPFDAKPGSRTGLVVGYVQSGKTMSMMTVTALARDNGCRIVVLLAGVTTNLLKQNASRFRDTLRAASGPESWLIINSEDGMKRTTDAQTLRQAAQEWRDKTMPESEHRTILFAILKQHAHMDWLATLLSRERLGDVPALILDDEADQASLNLRDEDDPSTTFRRIRTIREALPNHTYLQYTATPQAPLLISIDDMLSPQFAELVSPGDGYTGGTTFFPEKQAHPYVIRIPVSDHFRPGELDADAPPSSLVDALAVFFVGCAACRLRGDNGIRSMLVHPSQRTEDHRHFLRWVQQVQKRWSSALAEPGSEDAADVKEELKKAHNELKKTAADLPSLEELLPRIRVVLSRALSKQVNSSDASEVDWENANNHILVGGEKLNRGYTVEGLMVTYMPRGTGGWNADTIQQRARFFGYKRSYLPFCRIYLHPEVHDAYTSYITHERDVRRQLEDHRGRPLRSWRRAFFLDAKMRPTRSKVISSDLFRVKSDSEWFVSRYPHESAEALAANQERIEAFRLRHSATVGTSAPFEGRPVRETTLDVLLDELLLEINVPREAGTWMANLVTLSDERARDPKQRVLVVELDTNGGPRDRSEDAKGALTLHQGRTASKKDSRGDKDLFEPETVTVHLIHVQVTKNKEKQGAPFWAIAAYIPKAHDAIAGDIAR